MTRVEAAHGRTGLAAHPLAVYLVLAFGLSWWPWPLVLLNPASTPLVPFGPAIAGVATMALLGRGRVTELFRSLVRWRVPSRCWAVAVALPLAVPILAGLGLALTGTSLALPARTEIVGIVLGGLGAALVGGPLTEEPGWRGAMLPLAAPSRGWARASIVVGITWIAWHLPLLVSSATNQRDPVPFALTLIGISPVLAWLWVVSRSLLLVVIAHALVNTSAAVLLQAAPSTSAAWWANGIAWVLPGVIALALLAQPSTAALNRSVPQEVP